METIYIFLIVIFLIFIFIYLYLDRKYSYWKRKNVPYLPPKSLIFGNASELIFEKESCGIVYDEIYRKFEGEPYCGFYEFQYPILLIRDLQLVQTVLVEKFNSFHDNKFSISVNPSSNQLLAHNPFVLSGERWKEVRTMLVPGITSSKLRALDDIIKPVFTNITKYLDKNQSDDVEAFELSKLFTGHMVAHYGWGISGEGFSENSPLKEMIDINQFSGSRAILLQFFHPFLARLLRVRVFTKEFEDFFRSITSQAINALESSKNNQPTFLQNILNAREKLRQKGKDINIHEISSYMNTFYADGYETTARVLSIFIQYLMMYPDVQQRLREEVNEIKGEFTIESASKLQYMEMVLSEVGRIFPVGQFITRTCTEKCKLGTLEVDVGTTIIIPVYSIHNDPKYYPNPEIFNPENFSDENKSQRHKFTHSIFGHGPRMCLGMKYAVANMKLFLCYLLRNYEILPPSDHPANPMKYDPQSVLFLIPKGEMFVKLKKITQI